MTLDAGSARRAATSALNKTNTCEVKSEGEPLNVKKTGYVATRLGTLVGTRVGADVGTGVANVTNLAENPAPEVKASDVKIMNMFPDAAMSGPGNNLPENLPSKGDVVLFPSYTRRKS